MKSSIKMSILPLLICLSLNGKALADSSVPLSCNEFNYENYIYSYEKTQELTLQTLERAVIFQGLISPGLIS